MKGNYGIKKNWTEQGKWDVMTFREGYVVPFATYKSEKIAAGVMWLLNKLDGR